MSDYDDLQNKIKNIMSGTPPGATRYLEEARQKVIEAERMHEWEVKGDE